MAKKIFQFQGKKIEELKEMSLDKFAEMVPSRQRRSLKRNAEAHKKILKKLEKKKEIKTHQRELVILPQMIGKTIKIHNGKEFVPIIIQEEMIGCNLGDFSLTRKKVAHSSPGVGATRSSSNLSMK